MAQENFIIAVAISCQIFIGSVLEIYMKFYGLPSHFHRLFSGCSARNKTDQIEKNSAVQKIN